MKEKILMGMLMIFPLLFFTCRKSGDLPAGTSPMNVRMTDAPSPYGFDAVLVDVQSVQADVTTGATNTDNWVTLSTTGGVYNLLDFSAGFDTLIAHTLIASNSTVSQVRLVLGSDNSVVINGTRYPMDVPSGSESGLKINVHESVIGGQPLDLVLDFDAAQSVVKNGDGSYSLKPVIRGFVAAETGTVTGSISMPGPGVAVTLQNSVSLYTTYANSTSGQFMLRGIASGVYTLSAYPKDSDVPVVSGVVTVKAGTTTDAGVIIMTNIR